MIDDKIVITRTPLRISFIGGGTDMPYFYNKNGNNVRYYISIYFHFLTNYFSFLFSSIKQKFKLKFLSLFYLIKNKNDVF
jgi:D-glycero-alpha-D-manno-heptose-7-phosphate kinase